MSLLTDPVLRRRTAHLLRAGPLPEAGRPDAVLISHGHLDHLDLGTLDRLPRETLVVVPRGLGKLVELAWLRTGGGGRGGREGSARRRRRSRDAGGSRRAAGARPIGSGGRLPRQRQRHRVLRGRHRPLRRDGGARPGARPGADPDLGLGPDDRRGHLDPARAADALALLRPRIAVPIHWGTLRPFYRSPRAPFLSKPLEAFLTATRERAPEVEIRPLELGQSVSF